MTLSEHISNVYAAPDKGTANRAKSFTKRQIASWIISTYGFLMTKDVEKYNSVPANLEADLGCWPLESVDQADCPACWNWGDDVKKAVFPAMLECKNGAGLSFFGLIDKRTRITVPVSNYGSLNDYKRFPAKLDWDAYMIGNNTIYIKWLGALGRAPTIKTVNIRGLLQDPREMVVYNPDGTKRCYDWNVDQFPISSDLVNVMYELVWKNYLAPFVGAPRDMSNEEANKSLV